MAGTYSPGTNPTDAFRITSSNVAIYGGFSGNETSLSQRDWFDNETILTGSGQNAHVVIAKDIGNAASEQKTIFLDGFRITGGTGSEPGGGVQILNASLRLSNLYIYGNSASRGGGVHCEGNSAIEMINVLLLQNKAITGGGFNREGGCIALLYGVAFQANQAATGGAAANTSIGVLSLVNSSISGNTASVTGAGLFTSDSTLLINNSILWKNYQDQVGTAPVSQPIIDNGSNVIIANNSIIEGGYPGEFNELFDPRFSQDPSSGADGEWGTSDDLPGDLQLRRDSPAIDIGDTGLIPSDMTRDLRDWPRILPHPSPDSPAGPIVDLGSYEAGIIHVKKDAAGTADGSSWQDAFTNPRDALGFAHPGDEIWVARGTYLPGSTRDSAFNLQNDVIVFGGFAGSETLRANRDWQANPTILSGDIGAAGVASDNVYHVVTASATGPETLLDGFVVRDGLANGAGPAQNQGAGIYIAGGAAPRLENLLITKGQAAQGGGIFSTQSSAALLNVTFLQNQADLGGGLYLDTDQIALQDVTFQQNTALVAGGGIYSRLSTAALRNATVTQNQAKSGAGVYLDNDNMSLLGVTFSGNLASTSGGGMFSMQSNARHENVTYLQNEALLGGGLYLENDSLSVLTGVTFQENKATTSGGGIYSYSSKNQITGATFLRNRAPSGAGIYNTKDSILKFINVFFLGNVATTGGGIQNTVNASLDISNAVFAGNYANQAGGILLNQPGAVTLRNVTLAYNAGGAFYSYHSTGIQPQLSNVIVWDNTGRPFTLINSTPTIDYSVLVGGCPNPANCTSIRSNDPLFVRNPSPGADAVWGTADDDYGNLQVTTNSPAIDSGRNSAVLSEVTTDIAGLPRFADDPNTTDSGEGTPPIVDIGAYEAFFLSTAIVSTSPSPSVAGQPVTVTFSVTGGLAPVPGSISVSDGISSCTAAASQGSCTLVFQTAGEKQLQATYSGDGTYGSSSSAIFVHTVKHIPTSLNLSLVTVSTTQTKRTVSARFALNPGMLAASQPGGTVTVSTAEDTCTVAVSGGECSLSVSVMNSHVITARYNGDQTYAPADSPSVTLLPEKVYPLVTIQSIEPVRTVSGGEIVRVTFTVTSAVAGAGTPSGNVIIGTGKDNIVVNLSAGVCELQLNGYGEHAVVARYLGDGTFAENTSIPFNYMVKAFLLLPLLFR